MPICHISMQCIFKFLTILFIFWASDLLRLGLGLLPASCSRPRSEGAAAAQNLTTAGKAGPVPGQGRALIEQEVGLECPV